MAPCNCASAAELSAGRNSALPGAAMESLPFSTSGHLRIMVTFQIHSDGYLNPEMMFCLKDRNKNGNGWNKYQSKVAGEVLLKGQSTKPSI